MATPVTDPAILAQLNGSSRRPVTDPAILAQLNGPQPSGWDKAVASPIGRFAHDVVVAPALGLAQMAPMIGEAVKQSGIPNAVEESYKASMAANRNTPGYVAARAKADSQQALKGSGLSDQLIAPFLPTIAGSTGGLFGGSFDASNASADAASQALADYQKNNPILSTVAQIAGGFLAAPKLPAVPAAVAKAAVPTIADLKSAARAAYDQVDNAGHVISAPSYDAMVADLQSKLASEGIDKTLHPNALAAFNRVKEASGTPITFKGIDTMRRVAGDAIGASVTNKADQRLGHIVQDHIDDYVNGLQPPDLLGGTDPAATIDSLNTARDLYRRSAQASTIQRAIDRAQLSASNLTQSGVENALRTEFRSLAKNDRAMARLDPEVQDAVKTVVKGGPVSNLLRQVGKYAPHGPVSTATAVGTGLMLGGVEGGLLGSVTLPAIGELGRIGATRATKAAVQRTLDRAAMGRSAALPLSNPPLQLPQITSQSAFPLGLFGSSFQQQPQ